MKEIEALGVRVVDFDYGRSSINPVREFASVLKLARIFRSENPDVVHLVSMKPIVLGSGALALAKAPRVVVHMTGLGLLGTTTNSILRPYRALCLQLVGWLLRKPTSYLLVENPDDLAFLAARAADPGPRFGILPGAGVDADAFSALAPPSNDVPTAAFVGRMIRSKGVEILMRAFERLRECNFPLRLQLYGTSDPQNREAISSTVLTAWCAKNQAEWSGVTRNVCEVWRHADIFVLPTLGGEGMPRAMLEAAACARPLVVTDVPGCRQFVRDGVEGFVVPPGDAAALAEALQRLARDPELRSRMGEAARRRFEQGFTESHMRLALKTAYHQLAPLASGSQGQRVPPDLACVGAEPRAKPAARSEPN
jgi:glycosyltransferase involved in cell wall biosynthesis